MNEQLPANSEKTSHSRPVALGVVSILLGGAAMWYAWLRFANLIGRSDSNWYEWIQPSMVVLFALLCLVAAVMFLLRKPDALAYFKLGLSVIPLVLFINLMILLFRAVASLLQGNAAFLLERVLAQPHKFILIPVIVIALMLLGSLTNEKDQKVK